MRKFSIFLGLMLISFFLGHSLANHMWNKQANEEILFVQAAKVKNNLIDLQEIRSHIHSGCIGSAMDKISNDIDHSLMYLSEHINHFPDGELVNELTEQQPDLLKTIKNTTVDWSKIYKVRACIGAD